MHTGPLRLGARPSRLCGERASRLLVPFGAQNHQTRRPVATQQGRPCSGRLPRHTLTMIAHNHILGTFDDALSSLRNNVLMMSSLTERSLDRAITGLLQRDDELCVLAIADDEEIDQLE